MKKEKERNADVEQVAGAEGGDHSETETLGKGFQETRPRHHGGSKTTPSKGNNDCTSMQ